MVAIFSVILIKCRPVIFDGDWLSAVIKGCRELIGNRDNSDLEKTSKRVVSDVINHEGIFAPDLLP
jgi:hypothetical protein